MSDKRYFVDIFESIVQRVQELYDTVNNPVEKPYYLHGHILDIIAVLSERDDSNVWKFKKYPLIALIEDIEEDDRFPIIYEYVCGPRVLIIMDTSPDYHAADRYDNVFKTVLQPIYDNLIEAMDENLDIYNDKYDLQSTKVNRVYWGNQEEFGVGAHILNDYLDAIDIRFRDIKVFKRIPELCN